jgi:hypothetical protein
MWTVVAVSIAVLLAGCGGDDALRSADDERARPLEVTRDPERPEPGGGVDVPEEAAVDDGITTPCPEPPGGWRVVDTARADDRALDAAVALARRAPDHAGVWVDQADRGEAAGRPTVLTAAVTGDVDAHEQRLREVWGGPLCVVRHERTLAELRRIQDQVFDSVSRELGLDPSYAASDEVRNVVKLGVTGTVSAEQQAALDARFGAGVVVVEENVVIRPMSP